MQMTFFVFLPSILLSGFMFPFAGMPRVVQWLAAVLPLTPFMRLIRGLMLRGANLVDHWPGGCALLLFTALLIDRKSAVWGWSGSGRGARGVLSILKN